MRATKGYVAGVGTTSALIGAIGCAFALLTAIVAVQGWPLKLGDPGTSTVEGRGGTGTEAWSAYGPLPTASEARPAGRARRGRAQGAVPATSGPFASAFGPAASEPARETDRPVAGGAPLGSSAAGTAGPAPGSHAGATTTPGASTGSGATGGEPSASPPTAGSDPTLSGAVTEVVTGAGTTVSQTGQQLGGAVQGATTQLGGTVGQVSPAAGQAVTQTGEVAEDVVVGATDAAGEVVSGAGMVAGGLLGGLTGSR